MKFKKHLSLSCGNAIITMLTMLNLSLMETTIVDALWLCCHCKLEFQSPEALLAFHNEHTGNLWDSNPIKVKQIFERNTFLHAALNNTTQSWVVPTTRRRSFTSLATPKSSRMPPCATNEKYTSARCLCVCARSFTYICIRALFCVGGCVSVCVSGRRIFRRRCFGRARKTMAILIFVCALHVVYVLSLLYFRCHRHRCRRCKSCWWIIFIFNYPVVCVCVSRARADWALFNQHTRRSMLFCRPLSFPISPDVESRRRAFTAPPLDSTLSPRAPAIFVFLERILSAKKWIRGNYGADAIVDRFLLLLNAFTVFCTSSTEFWNWKPFLGQLKQMLTPVNSSILFLGINYHCSCSSAC